MSSPVNRALHVLLLAVYVAPNLFPPTSRCSFAVGTTSLELKLSSDVTEDGDIRLVEDQERVARFNYTLRVTGDANHTLALAVCVTVDDPTVAQASVPQGAIVPLHADLKGTFNVIVIAQFVGRAFMHVHFVVGHKDHVRCGQPEAENLQELLRVSEASRGQAVDFNITKISTYKQNSSSSSSVLGLHSGVRYQVVVLRMERVVDNVFQTGMVIFVVIINVGMGCKLDLQVVKATLRRPFAPVTGLCSQFIVMPLLSFAITQVFTLTPGVALGFFALGCAPGGSASNFFCYLLGGDVTLSITMTFVSTVISIGMLPMWMFTLGRYVSQLDNITIPFANILYSLLGLVAAVGAGLLLKTKKPAWAHVALTVSKVTFCLFIVFILTVGVYANLYVFLLMKGVVLVAAAVLPYAGFILGGLVALAVRMPAKTVVTIAVETGIQNAGVAIIILLLTLDHPESDLSIVAPATSFLFTPIPLWIAVAVIQLRQCYLRRKEVTTTSSTAISEERNASERKSDTPSSKENLCKKLFGESAPGLDCFQSASIYCGCDLSKEAPTPRDIEIVITETGSSLSPDNPTSKKSDSYEFSNLAMEKSESREDSSHCVQSSGTVPVKQSTGCFRHDSKPDPTRESLESVKVDTVLDGRI